ncbi:MAG: hypothetical protein ACOX3U_06035 [Christensenellales bacterium]
MGTLIAALNIDKTLNVSSDSLVLAGENMTSNLLISIPSSLADYDYYLEFMCPDERCVSTPRLELTEGSIVFPLPYDIIRKEGRLNFQVVARLSTDDTLVFKSTVAKLIIEHSINSDSLLADEYEDVIIRCENATQEAYAAVSECVTATADAVSAASAANSVTAAALQAKQLTEAATADANTAIAGCNAAKDAANTAATAANAAADQASEAKTLALAAKNSAEAAATSANVAATSANNAATQAENTIVQAQNAINETNTAANSAQTAANAANSSASGADLAASAANAAAGSANDAAETALTAANTANSSASEADLAASAANAAAGSANDAAGAANSAAQSVSSEIAIMQGLYNSVTDDLENNRFDGKSAYQYALEQGYQGSEEDFSQALNYSITYINEGSGRDRFAPSIPNTFNEKNPVLINSQEGGGIYITRIYPEKTVKVLPTDYAPSFVTPTANQLIITAHNSASGQALQSVTVNLPYPMYSIENYCDEVTYDPDEKRYYVTYRTRAISLEDYEWIYIPNALPNIETACFTMLQFTEEINPDNYYESGNFINLYEGDILNSDIPSISIFDVVGGKVFSIRVPRAALPDVEEIGNFLSLSGFKTIIGRTDAIRIPLDYEVSREITKLISYCPRTYLKAYTSDYVFNIQGEYRFDTKCYADTKAVISGGNAFVGSQSIQGDLDISGTLDVTDKVLTLRHTETQSLKIDEKAGIVIKLIDGENDAGILMDDTGTLFAGKGEELKPIAERTLLPVNMGVAYWVNETGRFHTSTFCRISDFLKLFSTEDITLNTEQWTLNGSVYEYTVYFNEISVGSLVFISYDDGSKEEALAAGIYKYNPVIGNNSVTLKADTTPSSDLIIKLAVIGANNN